MFLTFPERLKATRESLGINKAEAARLLNMSKMGYGRYESGERTPSYQILDFIARKFGVSVSYLCGESDDSTPDYIYIDKENDPELYLLVLETKKDQSFRNRMLAYYSNLKNNGKSENTDPNTQ